MEIPEGVTVQVDGQKITVKGPNGEVQKVFSNRVTVKVEGNKAEVECNIPALKGTLESILKSMILGVTEGYTTKMKVLYAHFPVSLEVKGKEVLIKNFLGEKKPRKTAIIGSTKMEVKGQAITLSGPDKEAVGQTAANLKISMKIKEKDGRIFQDGIYFTGE
jgi:large subunit ribosomal protein L6